MTLLYNFARQTESMKERFKKYLAVTALIVSVLASLLQFHSHDCGGHVRLDCNGHEFVLGCMHDSDGCADNCPCPYSQSSRHNHSNHDCPLHFPSPALSSNSRSSVETGFSIIYIADLPADIVLEPAYSCFIELESSRQISPLRKIKFLYSSPLRGSPVCV